MDTTPPGVLAHSPAAGATGVALTATVVVTFSEAVVPATLAYTSSPDPGGWSVLWNAEATAAYLSHNDLAPGQTYTFTVIQARDWALNPLTPLSWSFVTAAPQCDPPYGAAFDWVPLEPTANEEVTFSGTASGTAPLAFVWDFDGSIGHGPNPVHSYPVAGDYTVVLTVTNACGEAVVSHDITVTALPAEAFSIYLPLVVR